MPALETLPLTAEKRRMVAQIRDGLCRVAGVHAVVLGGSQARGLARPDSDLDIGLYYRETGPFSIDRIRAFAGGIARPGTHPVVTGFYEWGPWVNGGAWIQTPAGKVDLLYRNLTQALFALNERYFLSDKDAARVIDGLPLHPPHFEVRLAGVLARAGAGASDLHASVTCMREIWTDTVELTNGIYQARYEW